jgi:hypothetical protein
MSRHPNALSSPSLANRIGLRGAARRRFLAASAGVLLAAAAARVRAETALERPASLRRALQDASARGEPLVLLVSLHECPYCERVRRAYLLPLQRDARTPTAQIDIGTATPIEDVDGVVRSHDAVATRLHARFTPSVLFLGPDGREIAERLVGEGSPDFYGGLLEQRLDGARAALASAVKPPG